MYTYSLPLSLYLILPTPLMSVIVMFAMVDTSPVGIFYLVSRSHSISLIQGLPCPIGQC